MLYPSAVWDSTEQLLSSFIHLFLHRLAQYIPNLKAIRTMVFTGNRLRLLARFRLLVTNDCISIRLIPLPRNSVGFNCELNAFSILHFKKKQNTKVKFQPQEIKTIYSYLYTLFGWFNSLGTIHFLTTFSLLEWKNKLQKIYSSF
mgnify:CR=1 FL=1